MEHRLNYTNFVLLKILKKITTEYVEGINVNDFRDSCVRMNERTYE